MDIVVKGRNVEVPEHYRTHVTDKLHKLERYDNKIIRIDVELFHERNPRQAEHCQRVEITCVSRGPAVRAEACAADFYSALDAAFTRLDARLRRLTGRRRARRSRPAPASVAAATAPLTVPQLEDDGAPDDFLDDDQPWHIARQKEHDGTPMTVEDALFQMELVGHDFFLFLDKESGRPSVVYRRHAYDYGVIMLAPPPLG